MTTQDQEKQLLKCLDAQRATHDIQFQQGDANPMRSACRCTQAGRGHARDAALCCGVPLPVMPTLESFVCCAVLHFRTCVCHSL